MTGVYSFRDYGWSYGYTAAVVGSGESDPEAEHSAHFERVRRTRRRCARRPQRFSFPKASLILLSITIFIY